MEVKLNERAEYLLRFLASKYPLGHSKNQPIGRLLNGVEEPLGIDMRTFRGLERRGLVLENEHCLVYVSEKGLQLLQTLKSASAVDTFPPSVQNTMVSK